METSNLQENIKKINCLYKKYKPTILSDDRTIILTQTENEIFDTIKSVLLENKLNTTCRVAGGWVRDKLLKRQSDDIDIALDNISGEAFARLVNVRINGEKDKVGVVKSNPDKSKHLQTATLKICGKFVDFVNLRTEKYSSESRIPEISIGTPLEDALRRDITINTLFYNINTSEIEDFTEKGVEDLKKGIVRTPMPAYVTFNDDPLRILRTIRFSTRFNFELDEEIIVSSQKEEIKEALRLKISNERVRKELVGMFNNSKPSESIEIIYYMNLLDDILKVPIRDEFHISNEERLGLYEKIVNISNSVDEILSNESLLSQLTEKQIINNTSLLKEKIFFYCLTIPFKKFKVKSKKDEMALSTYLIKNSLVGTNEDIKVSMLLDDYMTDFNNLLVKYFDESLFDRLKWGLFIRRIKFENLKYFLVYSLAERWSLIKNREQAEEERFYNGIFSFINRLSDENLIEIDNLKPLLDGNEIREVFKLKPGKIMGAMSMKCIEIQIEKIGISKEELILKLKFELEEMTKK